MKIVKEKLGNLFLSDDIVIGVNGFIDTSATYIGIDGVIVDNENAEIKINYPYIREKLRNNSFVISDDVSIAIKKETDRAISAENELSIFIEKNLTWLSVNSENEMVGNN